MGKLVEVSSDDLLAGAGLADDEDGGLAGPSCSMRARRAHELGTSNTNALARPDSDGFADFGRVRTDITRPLEPSLACPPSAGCCAKVTAERGLASILSRVPGRSFNRSNRNSRDFSPYRPWSAQPSGPLFTIQAAVLLSDSDAPDHAAPTRPVGSTRARSILLRLEVSLPDAIPPALLGEQHSSCHRPNDRPRRWHGVAPARTRASLRSGAPGSQPHRSTHNKHGGNSS